MAFSWFDTLEKAQVIIYRRPNFLADDFEYEQYIGRNVLDNLFSAQATVKQIQTLFFLSLNDGLIASSVINFF